MSAGGDDNDIAIRVSVDTDDATNSIGGLTSTTDSDTSEMSTNWDQVGLSGARAARSVTTGLSGLLSAQQNVYTAQQRVNVANISYILTVREYGAGSIQAQKALDQLQTAQEGVTVSQDQLNLRYVQFALTTGPQVYTAITKMVAAAQGMTVANYEETASWYAKAAAIGLTIGLLTLGIGVFTGLIGAAAVNSQINQNNTFYGAGSNTSGAVTAANQQLVSQVSSASRP